MRNSYSAPDFKRNEGRREAESPVLLYEKYNIKLLGGMGKRTRDSSKAAGVWDCTCITICGDFVCCLRY